MSTANGLSLDRRSLLKGLGAVLGAQAASQLLGGQNVAVAMAFAQDSAPRQLQLLSERQFKTLAGIADLTIPRTDTPGALDTHSHWFVDNQLKHCFDSEEQAVATVILNKIDTVAQSQWGKAFYQGEQAGQLALLTALEAADDPFSQADTKAFKMLKALVVFGFFTSKVGMTQLLAYDPVPGGFKGSVPYASVGKAYSGGYPF